LPCPGAGILFGSDVLRLLHFNDFALTNQVGPIWRWYSSCSTAATAPGARTSRRWRCRPAGW
jgi:hypothetical protein